MEVILDCSMKSLSGRYLLSFRAHLRPKILALEEKLANSFSTPHVRGTKNKLQILMILKNTTIVVLKKLICDASSHSTLSAESEILNFDNCKM